MERQPQGQNPQKAYSNAAPATSSHENPGHPVAGLYPPPLIFRAPVPPIQQSVSVPGVIQRLTDEELVGAEVFSADTLAGHTDDELIEFYFDLTEHIATLDPGDAAIQAHRNNLFTIRAEMTNRGISAASGDRDTQQRLAAELVDYTRDRIEEYPQMIHDFANQTGLGATEKVRIIGRVAAAVARMEILLGNIYHQGGDWEPSSADDSMANGTFSDNRNRGYMVDFYTGKSGNDSGIEWCSRFATTVLSMISGDNSMRASSGYQIANSDEFASISLDYDTTEGGAFVGTQSSRNASTNTGSGNYNPWAALRQTLTQIENGTVTGQTAAQAVDDFFATQIRPQPGDLVIVRRGTASQNSFSADNPDTTNNEAFQSHTTMVDRMEGYTMHISEGNHGQMAQQTRSFDLTSSADVEEIVFISRPSLTNYLGGTSYESTTTYTEEDLMGPIDHINTQLERLQPGD